MTTSSVVVPVALTTHLEKAINFLTYNADVTADHSGN